MRRRKVGPEYGNHWLAVHQLYSRFEDAMNGSLGLGRIQAMMAFEEPMNLFTEGRRFCTTVNGYMGWVPQQARQGDVLCIFKGVEVPFLIRRALFKSRDLPFLLRPGAEYFQIIGECYIHGVMEGELLGSRDTKWSNIMLR
jgi:hypothetical protein